MKRIIDHYLLQWKGESDKRSLILRGARQVGKTFAARKLGETFEDFFEINLETSKRGQEIFAEDLDITRIIYDLSESRNKPIIPGKTLLFIDEIQKVPNAIIALRYFYEERPDLHVIAAGSLVDFAVEQVGMPVGRVDSLYMYPMTFLELLIALDNKMWVRSIINQDPKKPYVEAVHKTLNDLIAIYIAIGGMPAAINKWITTRFSPDIKKVHSSILNSYQQDFESYAKKRQIKYLNQVFKKSFEQLGSKFKYSLIGEYKKRELEPAIELLEKAGLMNKIYSSSGQGIPIGGKADYSDFKLFFLDVGLTQSLLGQDLSKWIIDQLPSIANNGQIVEVFVGQELLGYSDPVRKDDLFYWRRESRGSSAEVDYLVQIKDKVIPVEVKAGSGTTLKSMHMFLDTYPQSPYGIRFSTQNYSQHEKIHSYPLYAVAKPFLDADEVLKEAILSLVA